MWYSTQIKAVGYLKANGAKVPDRLPGEDEETLALLKILVLGNRAIKPGKFFRRLRYSRVFALHARHMLMQRLMWARWPRSTRDPQSFEPNAQMPP